MKRITILLPILTAFILFCLVPMYGQSWGATLEGVTVTGSIINPPAPVNSWDLATDLIDRTGNIHGTETHAGTNRTRINPVSGEPEAVGANVARFELVSGFMALLIEPGAWNYFLNSGTPVTQTTESFGTGTYTAWIDGTGSATIAANTATITGGGAATDGSPLTFVVTGAGTVDVTIAGGPTRCQVEDSPAQTSYIVTAGAKVYRATESGEPHFTLPTGLFDEKGTAIVWVRFGYAHGDDGSTSYGLVTCRATTSSLLYNRLGTNNLSSFDSTARCDTAALNWAAYTWYKLIVKWGYEVSGVEKFRIGVDTGSRVSWGEEITFDGAYDTTGDNIRLGFGLFSRMHLRGLRLFKDVLTDIEINRE